MQHDIFVQIYKGLQNKLGFYNNPLKTNIWVENKISKHNAESDYKPYIITNTQVLLAHTQEKNRQYKAE